ncbi:cyclohexanecarboxylate-CoA ligase [Burkholderia pseudomultivorans]|uniref:Medium-chain fatty-acid--CoA ligase n=1 Tax=Burkholderia pseudomultivorans TaxID=1207504 RepID=A0ABU2EEN6_9BURK|nr:cyclohexanecarboxylate-CoA ligase [Burkholderia pseudomultivorans]MDR8731823.1 Medium-chain fatty-acid--CoA ligase [Burkholderia pseudomultivorans]MDR8735200.1 Medium-chain fatty-acid--CoA ligase [Burkholderia pseudomultivorans]MDR8740979.1 Medium-chain fatty-acid--CoA ligase [Burkholderia pseudomultivorans]MDR8758086.1 Medium-chain fatty-acid--CoA ligase [Burkholderia pseudomultivorans]MDR8777580.1 Medium-chain fatty-acid--CoA ligase [Burkholderia pseudomultivorans]
MKFDTGLIGSRRAASIANGWWPELTINDALDAAVAESPDRPALTAVCADDGTRVRFTYRELARMADRIAVGLARLGVGRGDIVSMQLPNVWQFTLTYLACSRIGAVINPLMPIFRERELEFMLAHAGSKVMIVQKRYRNFDYEHMLDGLRARLPDLAHVVVIGAESAGMPAPHSFDALLCGPDRENDAAAPAILTRHRPGPDDVTQLLYTSGTTGEPKGTLHTANTLMSNIVAYAHAMRLSAADTVLMASPMAHQTGFMYGLMMPVALRAHAVLQDVWDPELALRLIDGEQATFTMASTAFLTDLADAAAKHGTRVPSLKTFLCAGAPIPGPLVERARAALGAKVVSAWGMTELGAVTLTRLDDDDERAFNTDGRALPGVELKVLDEHDAPAPPGVTGRLLVRSCSGFAGYLHRPHLNGVDADGWFDTGDLAFIDARGYLRIAGRSKDVIIRGGENIPVVEIEALLYRHPAIAAVAIVAYPDDRLGERACAVVVPKPAMTIDLPAIVAFLKDHKVALQYIPERLLLLDAMPTTPAGKVQKFRLRELVRHASG